MIASPSVLRASAPPASRRILALDGGGIRCLIGIEVLVQLEDRLQVLTGDPSRRLCQHFDLIAGTSGGAIVGTAVALGLPMRDIRDFVMANAPNMFASAPWHARHRSRYDETALVANMKQWFGVDKTLASNDLRTLLMVVMRNWSTDSPWLVSNSPHAPYNARHLDDCNLDIRLWELARASAAAPVYYRPEPITLGREKPYVFVFVDGGLTGFLNPAFKAFQFATTAAYGLEWPVGESRMTVVSVGAGEARRSRAGTSAEDIRVWHALIGMPSAMLCATVREQDVLCRTFGRCRTGHVIDHELGDMKDIRTAVEPRLFGYHRLSPVLSREGLETLGCGHIATRDVVQIDAIDQLEALSEIGRRYAASVVSRVATDCVENCTATTGECAA